MLGTNFFIWKLPLFGQNQSIIHPFNWICHWANRSIFPCATDSSWTSGLFCFNWSMRTKSINAPFENRICVFWELLSFGCCGGQKLLGSLHQLLLVESKEMKEASGDELSINTFIWVTQLIFLDYCLIALLPALQNWKATNIDTNSFGLYFEKTAQPLG